MKYEVLSEVQFFAYGRPTGPAPSVENTLSPVKLILYLCQKSLGHICAGLFLGTLFCSIGLCLPLNQYYSLDYCSYVVSLEIR